MLVDEKDPSKEKQVFVKTVKGMHLILAYNAHLSKKINIQLVAKKNTAHSMNDNRPKHDCKDE